jgi:uncharacterized protein YecT (DUF1311 family)
MRYVRSVLSRKLCVCFVPFAALCFLAPVVSVPVCAQSTPPPQPQQETAQSPPPKVTYDPAIFLSPVPADQIAFLKKFDGTDSGDVMRDKEFRKVLKAIVPDCMFHFGRDMPLMDAMDTVLKGSPQPAHLRDARYLIVAGRMGPYLAGRGFIWIDLQSGIGLGGFYFHPTNGEPTPTVTVFSRQVKEKALEMAQLPPAFLDDFWDWSGENRLPPVLTQYFISARNEKIVLEHDADYCTPADGGAAPEDCEQMNADAADIDMNAAYYLDQVHHATNATAWMIQGPEYVAWIHLRDDTCRIGPDPLACHIRMTREHTRVIINRRVPLPTRR